MQDLQRFRASVRTQQIVVATIFVGLVTLIVVAFVFESRRSPAEIALRDGIPPSISYAAAGFAAMSLVLAFVVPRLTVAGALRRIARGVGAPDNQGGEEGALVRLRQTALIITVGLLEGAGFLGAIGYMIEGHLLGAAVAGFMAGLILGMFPTPGRVQSWLERHERRLAEIKDERASLGR